MFRLRTEVAALALFLALGLGSAAHAQVAGRGMAGGFGNHGFAGGFRSGFVGQQLGAVGGGYPLVASGYPLGYGYGGYGLGYGYNGFGYGYNGFGYGYGGLGYGFNYGLPSSPADIYWPTQPQTYNGMGGLMDSIQGTSGRGW
jgi:hypothetical protein